MPEYKILSYSWTVERLRNELHFPQYPPFLNEVYESDEEYYRDGFGKHHTDVQKVLSHAAWSYNRFTADQSLKGDLVRDFKNLLHCLSHVAVRDYVDQYLKMLCGLGLGKEACRVLTEYLENCQGRKEGERISYKEALSLKDTYVNAGDQALFLKEDADTAIGFYKLAGADWNTDRVDYGKDSNSGMWRRKASAYEKLLKAEIPEDLNWINECRASNTHQLFRDTIKQLEEFNIVGIEKCDELVRIAEKATNRESLRTIHLMLEAIHRKYAMQIVYLVSKDPEEAKYRKLLVWWGRELYDKRYQLLRKYIPQPEAEIDREAVCEQMYLTAKAVYLTNQIRNELRVRSFDDPVCYYAPYESFKHMLPCKCDNREDCGRLTIMHVNYMNDPNEGQMIRRYVYGDEYNRSAGRRNVEASYTFMKCFTHMPDYLPMWNTYADEAQGVSVVLNPTGMMLYRVCYVNKTEASNRKQLYSVTQKNNDRKKINTTLIQDSLDQLIDIYPKMRKEGNDQQFDILLSPIQFLFKEKSYSYEQEIRMIIDFDRLPANVKKTAENKEKNEEPKLFVLSEKPVQINELILGPKHPNVDHNLPFLQEQLDEMAEITGLDAPMITASEIEFR